MAVVGRLAKLAAKKAAGRGFKMTPARKAALKAAQKISAQKRKKATTAVAKKVVKKAVAKPVAKKVAKKVVNKPVKKAVAKAVAKKSVAKPVAKKTAAVLKREAEVKAIKRRIRVLQLKKAYYTAKDFAPLAPAAGFVGLAAVGAAQDAYRKFKDKRQKEGGMSKAEKWKRQNNRDKANQDWQTALDNL